MKILEGSFDSLSVLKLLLLSD